MRMCSHCRITKPWPEFNANNAQSGGFNYLCKPCERSYRRELYRNSSKFRQASRERKHRWWRKRRFANYGLTELEYRTMVKAQGCKCAICGKKPNRTLHIDHDHTCCPGRDSCGKCLRGLICSACNTGIGLLKTAEICTHAAAYLARYKGSV